MCGIAGFVQPQHDSERDLNTLGLRMADALRHRGPDDQGVWTDAASGVGLAHQRLSILDVSVEGHQPMHSADGRWVMVFNGEIYNFQVIRGELIERGHVFRGHSDTEVMLGAFMEWGIAGSLRRFVGMFAFALWDRKDGVMHLGRDRMGEKPLYYGWRKNVFLFASELKALRAHPAWTGEIDRDALALFFRHNYIPAPFSIYRGIYKLTPGCCVSLPVTRMDRGTMPVPVPFWDLRSVAAGGLRNRLQISEAEAVERLDELLRDVVARQMIADVPLGAFLSGGIDSSAVVALMQAQRTQPVKTFTIGFHELGYNEARHAKNVARHLGTDHTEAYVTPKEVMAVIPRLPSMFDEPFSDSSQIPTYLLAAMTRRQVTVSLSGDGGDELFGGYLRYPLTRSVFRSVGWLPWPVRKVLGQGLRTLRRADGRAPLISKVLNTFRPGWAARVGDRAGRMADLVEAKTADQVYHRLISHWNPPGDVVLGAAEPATPFLDVSLQQTFPTLYDRLMFVDSVTYLPDDILVKVDRACMAVSLESRVPLLDHRVVEFAWQLPLEMKICGSQGKRLLRRLLLNYIPRALIDRPKMGFAIPLDEWLRGPLRDWAESLLNPSRLKTDGFLNPRMVADKWREHLSGEYNWQYHLWDVLMFQSWRQGEAAGTELMADRCATVQC